MSRSRTPTRIPKPRALPTRSRGGAKHSTSFSRRSERSSPATGEHMLQRLLLRARSKQTWVLLFLLGLLAAIAARFLWAEHHLRAARRALERRAYPEARAHLSCYH